MTERNQAQIRAQDALRKIQDLAPQGPEAYQKYKAYANSLPATIITNGLGQALAMQHAVKDKPSLRGHDFLNRHIEDWLRTGWEHSPYKGQENILNAIVEKSESDYIRAQVEVMAYLEWLKKFATAFLEDDDNQRAKTGDM